MSNHHGRRKAQEGPPRLLIVSGAGLSAPSGVATFRASDGLWAGHDIRKVCHAATWKDNFDLVHAFYNGRREELGRVEPNPAHALLARWEADLAATHLTQNVDDLLERAGANPVHLHGFLPDMRCTACGEGWRIGARAFQAGVETCPKCGSKKGVKPDIVFFGDPAPMYKILQRELESLRRQDALLCVGTAGAVLPVANFAAAVPARSFLNNLEPSASIDESAFDRIEHGSCDEVLPRLEKEIRAWFEAGPGDEDGAEEGSFGWPSA